MIVWAIEMAAQPEGFVIGEEELAEAIVEVEVLAFATEAAMDDIEDYIDDVVDNEDNDDDIGLYG